MYPTTKVNNVLVVQVTIGFFFDKTYSVSYVNVCSENTSLNDSSNNLTAYQELSTDDSSNK